MPRDCTDRPPWPPLMYSPSPIAGTPYTTKLIMSSNKRQKRALSLEARSVRKAAKAMTKLEKVEKPPSKKKGTTTGKVLNGIVSTAARGIPLVGNFLAPILGELSEKAGDAIQGWVTGSGDYEVEQNSLLDKRQVPLEVRNDPTNWTVIRKREFLGEVFTAPVAGEFAVQNFSANIGLPTTCPWGSGQGRGFREYLFSGALVEFESTTSPIASGSSPNLGSVVGAVEYNSSKTSPFATIEEMENQDHSVSKATSASWVMPIECAREETVMNSGLFVRTGPLPANQPAQFYDHCVFSIGLKGQQYSSQSVGRLYFVYEVYLRKPTIVAQEVSLPTDLFVMGTPFRADMFGGVRTNPSFTPAPTNSLRGSISRDDGGRYIFANDAPAGDYEFRYYAEALSVPSPGPLSLSFSSSPNVTLMTQLEQLGSEPTIPPPFVGLYYAGPLQFASGSNLIICGRVRLTGVTAGGWFQLGTSMPPDWSANFGSLLVSPVSQQVVFPEPFLLGQPSGPTPRVALPDSTLAHHMECFEAAETADEMKVAVEQFKRFLAYKKLPSKTVSMSKYLPAHILAKAKALNFGEERQVDVDGILDLVKIILADKTPSRAEHILKMRRRQTKDCHDQECTDIEDLVPADNTLASLKQRLADLEENLAKP